jgi:hydrogenase small subunit
MPTDQTLGESLRRRGISRRAFLKFCAIITSLMALPPSMIPKVARALEQAKRPSVIWLSFQECTGCTESLTRSHSPTLEDLIFNTISLDYHHTLQAASGYGAEEARLQAMQQNAGKYFVVVDGSIPTGNPGYSTIAGISNVDMFLETVKEAAAVIAVGTCAAFGGIPHASPNPTGAVSVAELLAQHGLTKPIVNIPGCPPIPVVITGVMAHILTFGSIPELDIHNRPVTFFGQTIHDRCYRRPFYEKGWFAESFDDEGAKQGWCLYKLGCKGPITYNACAITKWNNGVSFPIQSGHGCLGCSEPNFWDKGSFYLALPQGNWGTTGGLATAAAVGVAVGLGAGMVARNKQKKAQQEENL